MHTKEAVFVSPEKTPIYIRARALKSLFFATIARPLLRLQHHLPWLSSLSSACLSLLRSTHLHNPSAPPQRLFLQ